VNSAFPLRKSLASQDRETGGRDDRRVPADRYLTEETRGNFQDAPIVDFEAMREVGEPIPEPYRSVDYVEVAG